MSAIRAPVCECQWRWSRMIPWYRQVFSVLLAAGFLTVALVFMVESTNMASIMTAAVVIVAMMSMLIVFGVPIDHITIGSFTVEFDDTGVKRYERVGESEKSDDGDG